ncbi:MAG: hypothetical protein AMS21_02940 [Gemmatimonas sp. SG8_38_2]|nr:MAG: hypothetical protein AMS21_02940 [Gemmatimonas sp. SG8_38_2]
MTDETQQSPQTNQRISRRDFVRVSALAAGSLALGVCREAPTAPPDPTARVAAVRGDDLYGMAREVLESIGGIDSIVHEGESVFVKPNMVTLPWASNNNTFTNGECTKPEILIAVAEECLHAGASEVVIGDGSQMKTFDWEYATTLDGSTNLVAEVQSLNDRYTGSARLACLEADSPAWDEVPSRGYLETIAVSSLVTRADRVITIPVAKTHSWAQLTLSSKNFVGVTSMDRYAEWTGSYWDRGEGLDHSTPKSIAEIYLDVVNGVKPDLAIIDFSIGIEGDGPGIGHGGRTVDMKDRLGSWLLLASTDIMAADATAARIMSHDVGSIAQLQMGYDMGLGEIRENRIEMLGENLEDLQMEWAPAELENRYSQRGRVCPMFAAEHLLHGHHA